MEITRDGMIAAGMAERNFEEKIAPVIEELNTDDAKKGYIATIITNACVKLASVTGEDFEKELDELVAMNKMANRVAKNMDDSETCPQTPSKPL